MDWSRGKVTLRGDSAHYISGEIFPSKGGVWVKGEEGDTFYPWHRVHEVFMDKKEGE